MDLTARPVEERDLPACLALLRGCLAYPDDVLAQLLGVWRRLLREETLVAAIVEAREGGTAVAKCFGASVFATDAWMAAARCAQEPYLSARTIRSELAGRSPILRPTAIGRSNDAGGLGILILHYGEARKLSPDEPPAVRQRMFEAFLEMHRGYRIKEILQEFWDEIDPEYVLRGWGRVLTDYASYFERRGEALPPLGRRPHLVGITREEVKPGDRAASLFIHTPPRLSFTRAEQQMLRAALLGQTDLELARCLGLALPTVKSRWRGIYDRVGRVAPDLLPDSGHSGQSASPRGREKRRRLLEYVRRHPEELRSGLR